VKASSIAILAAISLPFAVSGLVAGEAKIALAGDSTVADYPADSHTRGWGQYIGESFKDGCEIKNFAAGGRSTKTFISEGRWEKLLASKPDLILLQFGHNDSHAKDKPESTDAATDYKEFLRKYADDAKKAGIEIVFITSMHRRLFEKSGTPTEELLPYANAMKEVAREKGVPCVDLHASSGELLKSLGDDGSEDLFCSKSDRTHFSEKGAREMAKLIAEGLKSAGSAKASSLLK